MAERLSETYPCDKCKVDFCSRKCYRMTRWAELVKPKLEEYEQIGEIEEYREAVGKQKPKRIVYESSSVFSNGFTHYRTGKCPVCGEYYSNIDEINYCCKCGQALDWRDKDE